MKMILKRIIPLLIALILIIVPALYFELGYFETSILIIYFLINLCIIVYGLSVYWDLFGTKFKAPELKIKESDIDDFTKRVFESDNFLNAFETSLPKGENDNKFGLDYIPYMLKNIDERRKRFTSSSNRFLNITVVLGIIFITITVWFGYILINEDEFGSQRIINKIDIELRSVKSSLDLENKSFFESNDFKESCQEKLDTLEVVSALSNNVRSIRRRFNSVVREVKKSNNVIALRDSLLIFINETPRNDRIERKFSNDLLAFEKCFSIYLNGRSGIYDLLRGNINRFEKDAAEFRSLLNKPNNRLAELIKRLVLSLVVISFFIAILRYAAGLYKAHLSEMIVTEKEDLAIRKFYVILKTMDVDGEERSKILSEFLIGNSRRLSKDSHSIKDSEEISILKNIINTLVKKI